MVSKIFIILLPKGGGIRMSMKIDARYGHKDFKISIGTGRTFIAYDSDELCRAIDHYFGQSKESHAGLNDKCPLCRATE